MNNPKISYNLQRSLHWNSVSRQKENPQRLGAFYQKLLSHYYRFYAPEDRKVLELGCGHGELIASVKPSLGVGVDISDEMLRVARKNNPDINFVKGDAHEIAFNVKFDIIIISDLINDLWDAQLLFENLHGFCHEKTRIILNFYNNIWQIPLKVVSRFNLGAQLLQQNWFSPHDVFNLLNLAGFDVIKVEPRILLPLKMKGISNFINRIFPNIWGFKWLSFTNFVIARPGIGELRDCNVVSVVVPARNEAGNIEEIFKRIPQMGSETELIFVEGHSTDDTYRKIENVMTHFPERRCRLLRQKGTGKGDAVRLGFEKASGDILMILDADMTVAPEDLPRFYDALLTGRGEFINGVRLVYPLENQSMRFLNMVGNKFFSLVFSWLLGQPIKDTLCGTKVLRREDYYLISKNRAYFGEFDPFGDFDLLFGASKLNLKIIEMPIRYRARKYGDTNIDRWRHGWLLMKMAFFAAKRIKFV